MSYAIVPSSNFNCSKIVPIMEWCLCGTTLNNEHAHKEELGVLIWRSNKYLAHIWLINVTLDSLD